MRNCPAPWSFATRAIVRRAIGRGDLPARTFVTPLLDALCGGAMMRVMSAPPDLRELVTEGADVYAERLVDLILGSAIKAREPGGGYPVQAARAGERKTSRACQFAWGEATAGKPFCGEMTSRSERESTSCSAAWLRPTK